MVIMRFFPKKIKIEDNTPSENSSTQKMNNVLNSMFLCTPLYDKLKLKCHPDRFLDDAKKSIAEQLFQELQKNRYNYDELINLETKIREIE